MISKSRGEWLYLLNFALLFTHEIDSAYWSEWELFGIPGGIQLFLVLNFLLMVVALWGFVKLLKGERSGRYFSLLLAGGGVFAFTAHSLFIAMGHPQFRLPASLVLLGLILAVSLAQGYYTLRALRSPSESRGL